MKIPFAHSAFFTNEASEALAEHLVEPGAGRPRLRSTYVSGGSEANETAIKLARQYFLEIGQPERRQASSPGKQSYHGNTLGALAAGGNNGAALSPTSPC